MEEKEGLSRAREVALRLLARRDHGEQELAQKLLDRGFAEELVSGTIAYFRELGYLNDRLFAARQARRLAEERGLGDRRLRSFLRGRGISEELTAAAIDSVRRDWSEEKALRSLIRKKTLAGYDRKDYRERQKLIRRCLGRGFPPELIYELIKRAEEEDGHDDDGK